MRTVQAGLLALYRAVTTTGVLNTAWGRTLFETMYWFYKRHCEAGSIMSHQTFRLLGPRRGEVLAIELEVVNYARLQRAVTRAGFAPLKRGCSLAAMRQ